MVSFANFQYWAVDDSDWATCYSSKSDWLIETRNDRYSFGISEIKVLKLTQVLKSFNITKSENVTDSVTVQFSYVSFHSIRRVSVTFVVFNFQTLTILFFDISESIFHKTLVFCKPYAYGNILLNFIILHVVSFQVKYIGRWN